MGVTLRREALLARVTRAAPRMVAMTAPAGYGKTALAMQCLEALGGGAFVDGDRIGGELDLARRILDACPPEAAAVAQTMLSDGGAPLAERLEAALRAWRAAPARCVVFDRAEHIFNHPGARDFLARVLSSGAGGQTAILCSREPLRSFPVARHALPHELVVFRAADLAFDLDDVRRLYAGAVEDEALLERVHRISQGWPVAVLLLLRFAEEGRLSELVDDPGNAAFRELHDYLSSEVLVQFDDPLRRAIFTCASLGDAYVEDFAGFDEHALERLTSTGFVSRDGERLRVHPFLSALILRGKDDERLRALRELASAHRTHGRAERAAEVYLQLGDQYAAADTLGTIEVIGDRAPSARYQAVLARLDPGSLLRFPRLWGVHTLTRLFCEDASAMLDESETVWRTLPPSASMLERYYVLVFRVLLMSYIGALDEAFAALADFTNAAGAHDPPQSVLDAHLLYLRGLLRARRGEFFAGERDINAALPFVERMDVVASGSYMVLGADIARVRGEWSVERQFTMRARERAGASGLPNFIAFDVAEALIGAWLAGDRQAFNDAAVELERLVETHGVHGFSYLAHVARGRAAVAQAADLPKCTVFGMLIALSRSRDEAERAALERAREFKQPFVEALSAIAAALCEQAKFDAHCTVALAAASRCEAPAFLHAVNAFSQQHDNVGMLTPFVEQITRDRSEAAPVALDVLGGRVRVDGAAVRVSGRELELLAALAQRREPTSRARLASMLWPDLDEFAARNALSVLLHRLRSHLRRDDAIERDVDGYRLHADAFVDLWEIERAAGVMRSRDHLREGDRALLARALDRLGDERHAVIEGWEWFAAALRRLDDLRTELAHRLASEALERGDPDAALGFAGRAIAFDPCDEPAREIAIRAYLALGDRAGALRQYRQYRELLRTELAAEPSAALTELVVTA